MNQLLSQPKPLKQVILQHLLKQADKLRAKESEIRLLNNKSELELVEEI